MTLGTLDGANVEIRDHVGDDNIYIFGKHSDYIIERYEKWITYLKIIMIIVKSLRSVDYLISEEMLEEGSKEHLERLHHELISKDWFMTLIDLEEYIEVKNKMFEDYEDRMSWARKSLINIANAGFFSSDRTIADYNRDIWKVK